MSRFFLALLRPKFSVFNRTLVHRSISSSAPPAPPITHVVFDLDGVIIDSETVFYNVNEECLRRYGRQYSKQLKQGQMGMRLSEGVEWLLTATDLRHIVGVEEYVEQWRNLLHESLRGLELLPGAERLVTHLYAHTIPMAICTGSDSEEFKLKTANHKRLVEKIPTLVLTGDDPEVKRGKPAPDPYLITMARMRPKPASAKNVLVIEDAVNGARSAIAAGATTILIPQLKFQTADATETYHELKHSGLYAIRDSLDAIDPAEFGLPPHAS